MSELMTDLAPLAAMLFVAACILWLAWRAVRSLFRSPAHIPDHAPARLSPDVARREPVLGASAAAPSTIPDAADVLALKASIDALARQIAHLERRLAPANTNVPTSPVPRAPQEADIETARDRPSREAPLIVPDRRF